ncbi:exopolysaccharide biosynthesis protein [Rhizobium sp. P44RR-XXIV]|uniref:exopolysaccharide biosynthesis protein n=1 Tax=Rhizobium sp. P44RR-XXIV TaxID=1921145 RepID=UPI000984C342|nr:exopolysaccharide biosynthesis protein [Rhizobium sp. P44RR-XXIV]TIX87710.1 exopolysaccharide biosynthesis protein [Rhizobium sp. P44RR-XXIV]
MTEQTEDVASARLYQLARLAQSQGGISLGEILYALGRTSMAFTILVLALPPMIPIPGPFGVVFGTALAIVAVQIAIGRQSIWLPSFLSRRRLSPAAVELMVRYSAPILARVESMVRPGRLAVFTGRTMQWLMSFPIFVLAVAIALPIPLGNFLPVLALIVISVALIARDGLLVLAALLLSAIAFVATAWLMQMALTGLSAIAS